MFFYACLNKKKKNRGQQIRTKVSCLQIIVTHLIRYTPDVLIIPNQEESKDSKVTSG